MDLFAFALSGLASAVVSRLDYQEFRFARRTSQSGAFQLVFYRIDGGLQRALDVGVAAADHTQRDIVRVDGVPDVFDVRELLGHSGHYQVEQRRRDDRPLGCTDTPQLLLLRL
uniref:Putative secreted protein n=1 Tax=Ixodes ricinus TaxID=34613 RepID=A0A6B0UKE3_IXORI